MDYTITTDRTAIHISYPGKKDMPGRSQDRITLVMDEFFYYHN
jgi:hypothetical protein